MIQEETTLLQEKDQATQECLDILDNLGGYSWMEAIAEIVSVLALKHGLSPEKLPMLHAMISVSCQKLWNEYGRDKPDEQWLEERNQYDG